MNDIKKDLQLGILLSIFFLLVLYVFIPNGITIPQSHDPGQLSPASYPTWIATMGLCISLLLTFSSGAKFLKAKKCEEKVNIIKSKDFLQSLRFISAFVLLFAFYFFLESIGMIIGSFILYAFFAYLCGERNWIRLITIDTILIIVMYLFFVKIAYIPIPLGILEYVLY